MKHYHITGIAASLEKSEKASLKREMLNLRFKGYIEFKTEKYSRPVVLKVWPSGLLHQHDLEIGGNASSEPLSTPPKSEPLGWREVEEKPRNPGTLRITKVRGP